MPTVVGEGIDAGGAAVLLPLGLEIPPKLHRLADEVIKSNEPGAVAQLHSNSGWRRHCLSCPLSILSLAPTQ